MIRIWTFLLAALLVWSATDSAQAAYRITAQDRADIARIEAYLNEVRSVRSKFVQLASGGRFSEGTLYIDRPGRLRLDYKPPSAIQVFANGRWLVYVDTELEEVSHVPIDSTPAGFLVREKINLAKDITVERVIRQPGTVSLQMSQTGDPEAGRLTMTFADAPLSLRKWTVVDAQGTSTSVTLVAPDFNVAIPHAVFIFDEDRFAREID